MKKRNALWAILNLIFLLVFNALFFILSGFEHSVSVWISYAFIHFAYFMVLLTPKLVPAGKSSAVFKFSIYAISTAYFLLELITGVILILIASESFKTPFVIQLCIAAVYGIILVANMIANDKTAETEESRQLQISFIKTVSERVNGMLDNIDDIEAKRMVEQVYDAIYSSPVKSDADSVYIENRIYKTVGELESAVLSGNKETIISLANTILSSVNERNNSLRVHN